MKPSQWGNDVSIAVFGQWTDLSAYVPCYLKMLIICKWLINIKFKIFYKILLCVILHTFKYFCIYKVLTHVLQLQKNLSRSLIFITSGAIKHLKVVSLTMNLLSTSYESPNKHLLLVPIISLINSIKGTCNRHFSLHITLLVPGILTDYSILGW